MTIREYIKEKRSFILVNVFLLVIVLVVLHAFHMSLAVEILICLIWLTPITVYFIMDYTGKYEFYTSLIEGIQFLDQKYLLQNIIPEPEFLEGKIVYDIITTTNKSMHETVNAYHDELLEYSEFIELWVHEIKTPIAASKLVMQNKEAPKELVEEINYIEEYVEQVLYYARAKEVQKDYIIREMEIDSIVKEVIKKNARNFVYKRIRVDLEHCKGTVYTDGKWSEFILQQIVSNAIKYSKQEQPEIKFYTQQNDEQLILTIEDNGIGISEKDLPRVLQKGFTGDNGRINKKATGLGLYLCKQLTSKLYMGIEIESALQVGTKVHLIFPKKKSLFFEEERDNSVEA